MTRVPKAAAVVTGLVIIGTLTVVIWPSVADYRTKQAFAAYMESRKPYLAKVLEVAGTLPDELRESSGLAVSRTQPGVLWSHNDSGDGPNLYAIDQTGRLLGVITLANVVARDWEDIASGPCPAGIAAPTSPPPAACLYVADTGNNDRSRDVMTIYVLVEPVIGAAGAAPRTVSAQSFQFRYIETAEDSEALAVRANGDATIVSKGRSGTVQFFSLPHASIERALASGEVLTAEPVGGTGIQPDQQISRLVTGAAISPDGKTLAVRTYNEVFFYAAADDGGPGWRNLNRPCSLGDAEPQGEGIDYLDAQTLLLTSERSRGRPGTIHRLQC